MMNNQNIDTTSYWPFLNDLPRKSVGNIVTDYVVKVDKEGCERILGKILDQNSLRKTNGTNSSLNGHS